MAGIYAPIVTSYPSGVVTVRSLDRTPYFQIVNSMGSYNYAINKVYIKTNANSQLTEPIKFSEYDVNGTIGKYSQIVTVDPYQYQTSSIFEIIKDNVVLNGRTSLTMTILPNEEIFLVLYTTELANKDFLKEPSFLDNDFFRNYGEQI